MRCGRQGAKMQSKQTKRDTHTRAHLDTYKTRAASRSWLVYFIFSFSRGAGKIVRLACQHDMSWWTGGVAAASKHVLGRGVRLQCINGLSGSSRCSVLPIRTAARSDRRCHHYHCCCCCWFWSCCCSPHGCLAACTEGCCECRAICACCAC